MRILSQTELSRMSRAELYILLRRIAGELLNLKEGSVELRNAHANLRKRPVMAAYESIRK
jgi:hypothetical protein